MFSHRTPVRLAAAVLCACLLGQSAAADGSGDFSAAVFGEDLRGVYITSVPQDGTLLLGSRAIRSGDTLTAGQLSRLTFAAPESEYDRQTSVTYLPIGPDGPQPQAELILSIKGRKNEPPQAGDSELETYKNLPNEGLLSVSDPEGGTLTFTLVRSPRRGEVILRHDGSFLYTPRKNKVGADSFTFTAADEAGNVSREATVTVRILRPTDDRQYADTASSDCRFEAEWLRSAGLFTGETVSGRFCFSPQEPVTRGQFLAMLMEVLELPTERSAAETGFLDDAPQWLKPYLSAALRSGIITGYPSEGGVEFRPEKSITADEAARMVQNALPFALPAAATDAQPLTGLPAGEEPLTRSDTAVLLYRISKTKQGEGLFSNLLG